MNLPQDTPGYCQNQPNGIWLSIAAMRNMGKSSPRLDDPGEDLPTSSKSSFALTPRPLRPHTLEVIAVMAVKQLPVFEDKPLITLNRSKRRHMRTWRRAEGFGIQSELVPLEIRTPPKAGFAGLSMVPW
jgi:hypothetical protein